MTSATLGRMPARRSILQKLFERHRPLAIYGLLMIALGLIAVSIQAIDTRTLESGVGAWVKPAKFFLSVGVFALTAAWFFGYVRPDRRRSGAMRATATVLMTAGALELAYICWQAAHGLESHFNTTTPFFTVMYILMGVTAVVLVGTTLPLAWEIARRPAPGLPSRFVAAVVIGLVLTFLLGGGLGGYMSSQSGHAVGLVGGHVPLFGWNRVGGDLRIAHFLGIHSQQAMPILAAISAGASARARWAVLVAGALVYAAITVGVFVQALAGQPLFPG